MLNIKCLTPRHPWADIPTELISLLIRIARVCFCLGSPFGSVRQRFSSCEGGETRRGSDFGVWLPLETSRFDWSLFSVRAVPRDGARWNGRALLFASLSFCAAAGAPACTDRCALPERRLPMDTLFSFLLFFFSQVKSWDFLNSYTVLEIIDYKDVLWKCQSL